MTAEEVRAYLYEALGTPLGLVIETDNPELLRQRLYTERRKNPLEFDQLSISLSPSSPTTQLWIVNKGAPDGS